METVLRAVMGLHCAVYCTIGNVSIEFGKHFFDGIQVTGPSGLWLVCCQLRQGSIECMRETRTPPPYLLSATRSIFHIVGVKSVTGFNISYLYHWPTRHVLKFCTEYYLHMKFQDLLTVHLGEVHSYIYTTCLHITYLMEPRREVERRRQG